MADKTWDVADPRELPYRFAWNPVLQEIFIISMGRVTAWFENKEAFHRFLVEGLNLEMKIQDKVISEATGILKDKQGEQYV